ncbi:rhodanese-like domain-containing protein [Desulfogranum mediterraneum]|uniref:rhodanese-like domain-containing protein n=1 Tax=Desulfogranum mediterraneum TaxID=160661 RepID=UPI0003F6E4AB|nr:rhodanese-like domain-containing protein [Desulfogranum mediterraneum]
MNQLNQLDQLDRVVAAMDFDFLGRGEHAMGLDGLHRCLGDEHYYFLDVRSDQEAALVAFPFACHIPLKKLPSRLDELPQERCIVAFCSSIFRAAVAYTYLKAKGFAEVKGLSVPLEEMVLAFKPGPLAKR